MYGWIQELICLWGALRGSERKEHPHVVLNYIQYLYTILALTKLTCSHDFLGEYTPKQTNRMSD